MESLILLVIEDNSKDIRIDLSKKSRLLNILDTKCILLSLEISRLEYPDKIKAIAKEKRLLEL